MIIFFNEVNVISPITVHYGPYPMSNCYHCRASKRRLDSSLDGSVHVFVDVGGRFVDAEYLGISTSFIERMFRYQKRSSDILLTLALCSTALARQKSCL